MNWRMVLLGLLFWGTGGLAAPSAEFPPPGMTLPEYWGERDVWWHGRASFRGVIIVPACTLAMEDTYQSVDLGSTPVRDLQDAFSGPERRFHLRLRNCELAGTGKHVYSASRVRVTFDGVQGETPDRFSLAGQARGINLQITDSQGYPARAGKVMPPQRLTGNEETLNYTLRLVRNGEPLKAGDYYAVLRFKVDYE